MTTKDIEIFDKCFEEMSEEGQKELTQFAKHSLQNLHEHTRRYREQRKINYLESKDIGDLRASKIKLGMGEAGIKELIVCLIKKGYLPLEEEEEDVLG